MDNVQLEQLAVYYDLAMPLVGSILLALLILFFGWMASKWAHKLVLRGTRTAKVDEALARFLGNLARYTVLIMTVIAALGRVGVETTSLVAVFASAGLAVGLALQGTLGNFASGVLILFFRPFELDDVVNVAGQTGKVTDIGLFATAMMTPDNHRIVVPNSQVTAGVITNFTSQDTRRVVVDIGIAYGEDVDKAREVIVAALKKTELLIEDPEPGVVVKGFGASSVDLTATAHAKTADWWPALHNAKVSIYNALNEAKIEIPFNQLVVHKADPQA
ncbi:MAG: mechanosensitive ion channel family protein [Myxococcota bacterium]